MDLGDLVQAADVLLDLVQFLRGCEIGLVEQDQVGEGDLLARFGRLLELAGDVLGVDDGHHAVERELAPDALVGIEALRHRRRLRQPGGFDDHGVELGAVFRELEQAAHQIAPHRAADAAVVHLHDLLVGGDQQVVVDTDLAVLVHDDRDAAAVIGGQDAIEQRRLTRAEKPGQDDD